MPRARLGLALTPVKEPLAGVPENASPDWRPASKTKEIILMFNRVAIVVLASLLATGCASFRTNELPVVKPAELASAAGTKTRVFSRWSVEGKSAPTNEQMKAAGAAVHKKYFEEAITRSGCCVLVEGPTEAELVVDGRALAENNPAAMVPALITGLSLYTIPSWITARTHIRVEAKGAGLVKHYDLQDGMTMVQWLPMVLAMPFRTNPIKEGKSVDENVYNNLVVGMKKDGLLN